MNINVNNNNSILIKITINISINTVENIIFFQHKRKYCNIHRTSNKVDARRLRFASQVNMDQSRQSGKLHGLTAARQEKRGEILSPNN